MKTNVLFLWEQEEKLKEYLLKGLKNNNDVTFNYTGKLPKKKIKELYEQADIIIGWRPEEKYLKKAEKVKLYVNPGAGVKHLIPLFKELVKTKDITLVNGHGNSYFTAQHAAAMLLALTNKVIPHHQWMKEGKWRLGDEDAPSIPLRDRKIGLLGYGAINKNVHKFLSGFDVTFHILKRAWEEDEYNTTSAEKYSPSQLSEFLKAIDILIIAVPDTEETTGLIRKEELAILGEKGLLVNVSRGAVIDEKSLYNALHDKTIAGAAIDVWYNYKPEPDKKGRKFPFNHPFQDLDNVILSPHRAASPFDDLQRWDEVIENINRFEEGRKDFLNTVDVNRGY